MARLLMGLVELLPAGMDLDCALVVLMKAFPLTRQELKISLYRCVGPRDEEIAAELGLSVETIKDHGRRARWKLGFTACRVVGPFLLVYLHTGRIPERPSKEIPL